MDDPYASTIDMPYDGETGYYILPEDIRPWGKTILFGRTRGRICPTLVDLSRDMDSTYRANNRDIAIATITDNLQNSHIGDELWNRIGDNCIHLNKEDILEVPPKTYIVKNVELTKEQKKL